VAAYYPETNPLIPLDHVARKSNTPVSKAITIRLATRGSARNPNQRYEPTQSQSRSRHGHTVRNMT
ncbi:hypothetical protein O4328_41370, partial [Rhodococcus opacus]